MLERERISSTKNTDSTSEDNFGKFLILSTILFTAGAYAVWAELNSYDNQIDGKAPINCDGEPISTHISLQKTLYPQTPNEMITDSTLHLGGLKTQFGGYDKSLILEAGNEGELILAFPNGGNISLKPDNQFHYENEKVIYDISTANTAANSIDVSVELSCTTS
jgi:hypothetical protein